MKSIIVTGCGGDIGISVGRLLKSEKVADRIIGVDVKQHNPGVAFFDEVYQSLRTADPDYLAALTEQVEKTHADLVIPITDAELGFFADNHITHVGNAEVIMPNVDTVKIGLDKYQTYSVLKSAGIAMPLTGILGDSKPQLPCIIKMRTGHGGKGFAIIKNQDELHYHSQNKMDGIWQEYLADDDAEYTCGLFRSREGEIRTFILRRKLLGGLTGEGVVEEVAEIKQLLIAVAEALNLRGSINIQLRMTAEGPRIFEINPRFSSTVYFRHLLGFQDVKWSIQDHLKQALSDYVPATTGTRIFRTFGEVILPPIASEGM